MLSEAEALLLLLRVGVVITEGVVMATGTSMVLGAFACGVVD
jgi:Kef-type K+ transport system membrane component KefB